jgi:hypothetical protein
MQPEQTPKKINPEASYRVLNGVESREWRVQVAQMESLVW